LKEKAGVRGRSTILLATLGANTVPPRAIVRMTHNRPGPPQQSLGLMSDPKPAPSRSICVFCGSSPGNDPAFQAAAVELGRALVARGYGLVYGGASIGLMGLVADTVLEAGGRAIGVMPDFMVAKEIAHRGLSELKITTSMHERKDVMASLSHGFVALPGGFGTLEEFFEVVTWAQLGLHAKPCGLLNVNGYYDSLLRFFDTAVERRLLGTMTRDLALVATDAGTLLDRMQAYTAPATSKWIDTSRT
jgi:uncharacterized protein (TIGR00730 family)